jgi:hypothetical protein
VFKIWETSCGIVTCLYTAKQLYPSISPHLPRVYFNLPSGNGGGGGAQFFGVSLTCKEKKTIRRLNVINKN